MRDILGWIVFGSGMIIVQFGIIVSSKSKQNFPEFKGALCKVVRALEKSGY